jgi:urea transport system substrate-binding protein
MKNSSGRRETNSRLQPLPKISRRTLVKGTLAAGSLALPSSLATASATPLVSQGDTVKVGAIYDTQGDLKLYGDQQIDAAKVAIAEINEAGGLLGQTIELVYIDAQSDQQKYTAGARELALDPDIVMVSAGLTSASREAIRPIFDQYKKLYFYGPGYEGGVCDHYTFLTGLVPSQTSQVMVPYLNETYGPKLYIVAADYNAGHIGSLWVRKKAEELNMAVVGEDFFPLDVTDFSSTIAKIQGAEAESVFSILVGSNHLAFYRAFAASGLLGRVGVGSSTFGYGNEQKALKPEEGKGLLASLSYYKELNTPASNAYLEAYRKHVGSDENVGQVGEETYLSWRIWAEAVKKAATFETEAVIKALESGIDYDAPEGPVRMIGKAHHMVHTVGIGAVNDQQGWDIKQVVPDVAPSYEEQVCDLINNPTQSEQFQPEV